MTAAIVAPQRDRAMRGEENLVYQNVVIQENRRKP